MNILLVKMSSLGDVVQTIPVVHDILAHRPDAQIDWVVEEAFAPVVSQVRGLRRVIPIAQRRWRKPAADAATKARVREEKRAFWAQLQSQAYDLVLDLQGLLKSGWVMRQARIVPGGIRATYGNRSETCGYEWPVRFFANRLVPMPRRVHAVERYRLLAAGVLGYPLASAPRYDLNLQAESPAGTQPQQAVLFAHGTTRDDNRWPLACWAEVGHHLARQGLQVWIPQAGAAEAAFAQALAQELGESARVLPPMGLPALWKTMSCCVGVIGVDSGVSHMAVALDLPHVQIFSQDRAWRAGPVGRAHQTAVGGAHAPQADQVWQAWEQVLSAHQQETTP